MKVSERFGFPGADQALSPRTEMGELLHLMTPDLLVMLTTVPEKVLGGCLNRGVGIEIEVEDILESDKLIDEWIFHKDGSLRGNAREYVTPFGIRVGHAAKKLHLFEHEVLRLRKRYGQGAFSFGERTSVHVHLDVRPFTDEQIRALAILYTLFEDPLFYYAGPSRKSNVFTIPLRCSNLMVRMTDIWNIGVLGEKYCAINFKAMQTFGTVEFRHMEGTENFEKIFSWIMMLSLLVRFAQRVPLEDIQRQVEDIKVESQYDIFIRRVFFGFADLLRWDPNGLDEAASDAKLFFKG